MKKSGLITLGVVVAVLVAIVLAASQLAGGSSKDSVVAPEGSTTDLAVQLANGDGEAAELPPTS